MTMLPIPTPPAGLRSIQLKDTQMVPGKKFLFSNSYYLSKPIDMYSHQAACVPTPKKSSTLAPTRRQ